jgi:hypothetical protein
VDSVVAALNQIKAKAKEEGVLAFWATPCRGERLEARRELLRRAGFEKTRDVWVLKLEDVSDELIRHEIQQDMGIEPMPEQPMPEPMPDMGMRM